MQVTTHPQAPEATSAGDSYRSRGRHGIRKHRRGRRGSGHGAQRGTEMVASRKWFVLAPAISLVGFGLAAPSDGPTDTGDTYADLPNSVTVVATIRDFKAYGESGGHPDFERWTGGVRVGLVATDLDTEGKPVAASLTGQSLVTDFQDSSHQPINPALYDPALGDIPGSLRAATDVKIDSVESFAQWYRDGLHTASASVPITFNRKPGTNTYIFDSATDDPFKTRGGFFPIDGLLYGNYASTGHNFSFTTEMETQFEYHRGEAQTFKFAGDDDVWVFIGGKLVIDLGGVHSAHAQVVNLDRLSWLTDGESYTLKVFHAERHTTQSNFKIETTLQMRQVQPPAAADLAD